jgi:hypothetical protein
MKTALIIGAAAVGAYFLLKHLQSTGAVGSLSGAMTTLPPAAPGMSDAPSAAGTNNGSQMALRAAMNVRVGSSAVLGGIVRVNARGVGLPPTSFSPSSPGVSINQVPDPSTSKVNTITEPTPPVRINAATGLMPLTRSFGR